MAGVSGIGFDRGGVAIAVELGWVEVSESRVENALLYGSLYTTKEEGQRLCTSIVRAS